jgi:hypothetical protein
MLPRRGDVDSHAGRRRSRNVLVVRRPPSDIATVVTLPLMEAQIQSGAWFFASVLRGNYISAGFAA